MTPQEHARLTATDNSVVTAFYGGFIPRNIDHWLKPQESPHKSIAERIEDSIWGGADTPIIVEK